MLGLGGTLTIWGEELEEKCIQGAMCTQKRLLPQVGFLAFALAQSMLQEQVYRKAFWVPPCLLD